MKRTEEQKAAIQKQKRRKRELRRRSFRLFLFFVVGVLIIASAVLALAALAFGAYLYYPSFSFPEKYSVSVGRLDPKTEKMKDVQKYSIAEKDMTVCGEKYIDFSMLAKRCGFSVSGDTKVIKYLMTDGEREDRLIIDTESSEAIVNGVPVSLCRGVFFRNGDLWLPCEFVDFYINGITIKKGKGDYDLNVYLGESFSLILHENDPSGRVDISDV